MENYLQPITYNLKPKSGQAALSLVFLTGGIIVLIGVSLAFLAISFINSSFAFQSANKALAVASTGVNDVLIQLVRNKSFYGTYCVPKSLPCDKGSANVVVFQDTPSPGLVTIESLATSFVSRRKIKAIVSVNSTTTQVNLVSWELVPIPQGACPGGPGCLP